MITVRLDGLKEALERYDPAKVRQAAREAISRSADSGKSIVSEEVRKVYNVKKSDLDPRIRISKPRLNDLTAYITVTGKSMSLSYFGARQITGSRLITRSGKNLKRGKVTRGMRSSGPLPAGVSYEVLIGKRKYQSNTFLARVKAGKTDFHVGVFRRVTGSTMKSRLGSKGPKHREKISEKAVVSVASMAANLKVLPKVINRITERWQREFPAQLNYFLNIKK